MDLQYATSGTNRACERHALRLNLRVLKGAAEKSCKGCAGREPKLGGFPEALFQFNSEDKDRRHNMYAVIESGGKQHRVEPGEVLQLEKLDVVEGETIDFENVMLIGEGEKVSIGSPYIKGGKVSAEVLSHGRRDKITIIKMRRRKHYRRQAGHRQHFTEVKITEISGGS